MPPVPIIAPPEGHIPKFPSNAETLAKMRLIKYLEREASGRETDGLPAGVYQRPPPWMVKANIDGGLPLVNFIHEENTWTNNVVVEWEIVLGVGRKRREAAINWLLDVRSIVLFISCFLMFELNRCCLSELQVVHPALKVCPRMLPPMAVVPLGAITPRAPHLRSTQRVLLMFLVIHGQYTISKINLKIHLKRDSMRLGCFSVTSTSLCPQFPKIPLKIAIPERRGRSQEQTLLTKKDWVWLFGTSPSPV